MWAFIGGWVSNFDFPFTTLSQSQNMLPRAKLTPIFLQDFPGMFWRRSYSADINMKQQLMCLLWHASGTHRSQEPLWDSSIILRGTKGSYVQLPTEAVLESTIQNLGSQRKKSIHPSIYSTIFQVIIHKLHQNPSSCWFPSPHWV